MIHLLLVVLLGIGGCDSSGNAGVTSQQRKTSLCCSAGPTPLVAGRAGGHSRESR
jgi:hypothetical protein